MQPFESLVFAINQAKSLFSLSSVPISTVQQGLIDLRNRLEALETAAKACSEAKGE